MLNIAAYELIKYKIITFEYLPGSYLSESQLIEKLKVPRGKIRESLAMLARDNLIRIIPQKGTEVLKIDLEDILNSIFILKALLLQVLQDLAQDLAKTNECVAALQDLMRLDGENNDILDFDFYYKNHQFYLTLFKACGLERASQVIAQEKLHIERILRLSLKSKEDFSSIKNFNQEIFNGFRLQQIETSRLNVITLINDLERRAILAKHRYPYYFTDNETSTAEKNYNF